MSFEPEVWEVGGEHPDEIAKLVDDNVREALVEYISTGRIHIDYRLGGAPTVQFCAEDSDFEVIASFTVDLGDLLLTLFNEWNERDHLDHPMNRLATVLLATYKQWREDRVATDQECSIPEPSDLDRDLR
jgi:hypothetical protein